MCLGLGQNWCAREDLNLQPFRDQILSLARLPFRHARNRNKLRPAPGNLKSPFAAGPAGFALSQRAIAPIKGFV